MAEMKGKKAHGFPLNSEALKVLEEIRELNTGSEFVFTYQASGPAARHERIFVCNTAAYQNAPKGAGIERADWHTLRHTFASWAVQGGGTLQELMQLGPSRSSQMVLRYTHLASDHLFLAAERIVAGYKQGTARRCLGP